MENTVGVGDYSYLAVLGLACLLFSAQGFLAFRVGLNLQLGGTRLLDLFNLQTNG